MKIILTFLIVILSASSFNVFAKDSLTIHIEDIDDSVLRYKNLKSLTLTFEKKLHSEIEYIPEVVFKLKSLKTLKIRAYFPYGRIKAIPKEIGNLTNLETLSITGNSSINKLPKEITNLKKLKSLDLDGNGINDTKSLSRKTRSPTS